MRKFFGSLAIALALICVSLEARADDTLFADLGGKPGINLIVTKATANFLADKRIAATFDQTNMVRFKAKLAEQLCAVSDGPCKYTGHSMAAAHKGLHLTNADFDALVEDLQNALDAAGVPFRVQNRLLARLAPMQKDVVTR